MRIVFFVSSLNAGGAERVATTLANAWAKRGNDVTLVPTYRKKQASFYPLDGKVRLRWLADCPGHTLSRWLPGLGKWLQMRRLIHATNPDVVVSFLTNVNVNVLIASMGVAVPVIVSERTNPAYSQNAGKVLRLLRRLVYRRARFVVLQTQASVEPFKSLVPGLREVVVIPNPLPPALMERAVPERTVAGRPRPASSPDQDGYHLVAMGRLVAIKQFDVLIDAFAKLASSHPDWRLKIWGDGPLRDTLAREIHDLGLDDQVVLAGRTSTPWDALSDADMFVMTSRVEGFPNVLMEAMALGLPCVALDCPSGPAELTRGGEDARLVPLNDSGALINALQELMADPAARNHLGMKAAASVRTRYGLATVLHQWDAIFTRLNTR